MTNCEIVRFGNISCNLPVPVHAVYDVDVMSDRHCRMCVPVHMALKPLPTLLYTAQHKNAVLLCQTLYKIVRLENTRF
jgi:hypothetical protein